MARGKRWLHKRDSLEKGVKMVPRGPFRILRAYARNDTPTISPIKLRQMNEWREQHDDTLSFSGGRGCEKWEHVLNPCPVYLNKQIENGHWKGFHENALPS